MMERMTGTELREARKALGLTSEQLAARLRVNPTTVRKWESERATDSPVPYGVPGELAQLAANRINEITAAKEQIMSKAILRATLSKADAWGEVRVVKVAWIPEEVEGYDGERENIGLRTFAHDTVDNPPVFLERSANKGTVLLRRKVTSWAGTRTVVTEFSKVDSLDELEPGTFCIESDTAA